MVICQIYILTISGFSAVFASLFGPVEEMSFPLLHLFLLVIFCGFPGVYITHAEAGNVGRIIEKLTKREEHLNDECMHRSAS